MVTTENCDPDAVGDEFTDFVEVTQNGSQVTVSVDGYILVSELSGSICGDTFSARESASEEIMGCSGTETVSVSGTVDGESVTGQVSFSQRIHNPDECFGVASCSGSYSFTGTRVSR